MQHAHTHSTHTHSEQLTSRVDIKNDDYKKIETKFLHQQIRSPALAYPHRREFT